MPNVDKEIGYADAIADVRQIAALFLTGNKLVDFKLALAEIERSYIEQLVRGQGADYNHAAFLMASEIGALA